ncbi:MAG: hypothetical protein QOH54_3429, partial [Mycobacterium sp.]|nr:hypothetical protein [Mycobacterium sp.]
MDTGGGATATSEPKRDAGPMISIQGVNKHFG